MNPRIVLFGLAIAGCRADGQASSPSADDPIATVATTSGEAAANVPDAAAVPAMLSNVHYVLHVGDSTVAYRGGLAVELKAKFHALGIRYEAYSETSSGIPTLAKSGRVADLVRERRPDLVLISLGTNNVTVPHPSQYERDVRSIVSQVGKRPCYWIGPLSLPKTDAGTGTSLVSMVTAQAAPCAFFDSFGVDIERVVDGVHPTQRGAGTWADAFWTFMKDHPP